MTEATVNVLPDPVTPSSDGRGSAPRRAVGQALDAPGWSPWGV